MLRKLIIVGIVTGGSASVPVLYEKNPALFESFVRSAVETLDLVKEPTARERLLKVVQLDVQRLDRLVTDISNASRLDAELSRDAPRPFDLGRLLQVGDGDEAKGRFRDVERLLRVREPHIEQRLAEAVRAAE